MASILSQIHDYWSSNQALNAALPVTSVYLSVVPELLTPPYAVILPVSSVPEYTFGGEVLESYVFQVSIYHYDAAQAESIANTIVDQFEFLSVAGSLAVYKQNYLVMGEEASGQHVFHAMVDFRMLIERTVGD